MYNENVRHTAENYYLFYYKMDLVVELNSFSFYHKSKALYITAEILDFKISEKSLESNYFPNIEKGLKISLKSVKNNTEEISKILTEKIVFLNVTEIEEPRDSRQSIKYIFNTVKKCAISPEN